jgi:hypothetical protein
LPSPKRKPGKAHKFAKDHKIPAYLRLDIRGKEYVLSECAMADYVSLCIRYKTTNELKTEGKVLWSNEHLSIVRRHLTSALAHQKTKKNDGGYLYANEKYSFAICDDLIADINLVVRKPKAR